ncbi:MAG: ElyC/SanA/YdcF family protein [Chloroflexota bacterium]
MSTDNPSTTDDDALAWPATPSAILIMGKRQGTKAENKQLYGRIAMAAALWYSAPQPKPYLMFVASDVHGSDNTPDSDVVRDMLINRFFIPADYLILRRKSNCTLLEARILRVVSRNYGLTDIFALTHLYHAPRTQRYLDEVMPNASVIPVHPDILAELLFPLDQADLFADIQDFILESQPKRLDALREGMIEWSLMQLHRLDRRGKIERYLASLVRDNGERKRR